MVEFESANGLSDIPEKEPMCIYSTGTCIESIVLFEYFLYPGFVVDALISSGNHGLIRRL